MGVGSGGLVNGKYGFNLAAGRYVLGDPYDVEVGEEGAICSDGTRGAWIAFGYVGPYGP